MLNEKCRIEVSLDLRTIFKIMPPLGKLLLIALSGFMAELGSLRFPGNDSLKASAGGNDLLFQNSA